MAVRSHVAQFNSTTHSLHHSGDGGGLGLRVVVVFYFSHGHCSQFGNILEVPSLETARLRSQAI